MHSAKQQLISTCAPCKLYLPAAEGQVLGEGPASTDLGCTGVMMPDEHKIVSG